MITQGVLKYSSSKKSEVQAKLKEFEAAATNEAGYKIGTLHTDNGGEYTSNEFEDYLKKKGIKHETSISHSPQQNGVAECMNRARLESARAMVHYTGLSILGRSNQHSSLHKKPSGSCYNWPITI